MNALGSSWLRQLGHVTLFTNLMICTACNMPKTDDLARASAQRTSRDGSSASSQTLQPNVSAVSVASLPLLAVAPTPQARSAPTSVKATAPQHEPSTLVLKRLVIATGVQDREPLANSDALPGDGSAIYAFAELANPSGPSENVRITFERKGGAERVADVTLPVPANVSRHRTWAFTHFIRVPGVWEAVLWSENGAELGRTS